MKNAQFRLILASIGLPLMVLASMAASADAKAIDEGKATVAMPTTTAAGEATPTLADEAKPGRLRFRSAEGTCACTCAKGGLAEADIRQAEEARARVKN
jgi:uncharacterized metal-binding protein